MLLVLAVDRSDAGWTFEEALKRVRERLRPHLPPHDPRARAQYSDTNFLLLKVVLEAVTGRTVAEAYWELVFAPLGMASTFVVSDAEPQAERVAGAASLWAGCEAIAGASAAVVGRCWGGWRFEAADASPMSTNAPAQG